MNYYFDCQCDNFDHVIRFTYDRNPPEISVEVRMNDWLPWWKRVILALKYIFKMHRGLGMDYNLSLLKKDDLPKLENMIEQLFQDEKEDLIVFKGYLND